MTDVAQIVAGLTKTQREAVMDAITLLDHFAGEGAGMMPEVGDNLWADDVTLRLAEAFGLSIEMDFGLAVRTALLSKDGESADA